MTKKKIVNIKTRFGFFDCVFESNAPQKGYTVTVSKLKGVVTCGENLDEAKKMAKEAIELHCDGLFADNLAEVRVFDRTWA
jgi:predicted RNase H-like HicB family nuclease